MRLFWDSGRSQPFQSFCLAISHGEPLCTDALHHRWESIRSAMHVRFAQHHAAVQGCVPPSRLLQLDPENETGHQLGTRLRAFLGCNSSANFLAFPKANRWPGSSSSADAVKDEQPHRQAAAASRSSPPVLAIQAHESDPAASGGPEALVQLALALTATEGIVSRAKVATGVITPTTPRASPQPRPFSVRFLGVGGGMSPIFRHEYTAMRAMPYIARDQLQPGDVLVVPEVAGCDSALVARGVRVVVWLLASHSEAFTWNESTPPGTDRHRLRDEHSLGALTQISVSRGEPPGARHPPMSYAEKGCSLVAHNHWLRTFTIQGPALPLVRPYIRPTVVQYCVARSNEAGFLSKKRPLVVVDNDTPLVVVSHIQQACRTKDVCQVVVIRGMNRSTVLEHLSNAKIVVDWCFVGSERMPIEAVLCGAVLLTSASCEGRGSELDFPMPARNRLAATGS